MKKFFDIGSISLIIDYRAPGVTCFDLENPDRLGWKFALFPEWPSSQEDLLIRSPLFQYFGDRYLTAELKFKEGFMICTRLSITRCSRDERDFHSFQFYVNTNTGRQLFLMTTGPDVHGGRFFTHDFQASEIRLLYDCNECISFFCYPVKSPLYETHDEMSILPFKCKKAEYQKKSTQTDINNLTDAKDLGQNLKNLLLNEQDHDLVLKVQDKEFRAHRCILRVRSPVMHSMLSHDMIEKNRGVVHIPDCDPGAFQQFLLYLYSGEEETLDEGNMLALFCMADKYDVEDLKNQCREFIKNSLTPANLSGVIQFASDHNHEDLLECATDYFMRNATLVLRTVEWLSFATRSPILANDFSIKAFDSLKVDKK